MKNLITLLLFSLSFISFAQEDIDLFIWAGQSNALGRQGDAAQYPTDTDNLDSQIRFNWTVANGSNSGGWTTMQPQIGYFDDGHFGPEVTFSRNLVQAGYNPALFKFTQGATSIFQHWQGPGDGGLYDTMVNQLNTAITELENQGHTVNIRGFIWIQGESDSNSDAAANAYFNNLSTILNDLRGNVVGNANLPTILGVDEQYFNLENHERHQILNAHQDIALNDSTIKFTSMYGYPKADVTHLTPAGLISHGEDLFDSFQLLISGSYPSNICTLSSAGNHNSFERTSWGQSFTTSCSGTLSSISFEAISLHDTSATFTLYNGADCSGTVLTSKVLNTIEIGDNTVDLLNENIYLDKEHTYYFDIVSDNATPWLIDFSDIDNVFGVLRCTSNDGMETCGRTFLDYDMDFSVVIEDPNADCADETNIYSFIYNDTTYEVVKETKSWANAAACAVERGGSLARINDASEQAALWDELHNNAEIDLANTVASNGGGASYIWIGGTDLINEGTWIWDGNDDGSGDQFWSGDTNGNPIGGLYSNWGNEPDNAGNQDGLAIALTQWPIGSGSLGAAGQWNDLIVDDPLYYLIEYGTLSTNEYNKDTISVYPNPVDDTLTITNSSGNIDRITILNSLGQIVKTVKPIEQSESIEIDFSTINQGVYFVNILFEKGTTITKKVIK